MNEYSNTEPETRRHNEIEKQRTLELVSGVSRAVAAAGGLTAVLASMLFHEFAPGTVGAVTGLVGISMGFTATLLGIGGWLLVRGERADNDGL